MSHEETSVLKDSIMKLRSSFKPNHPLQFAVNTIEQGFLAITERASSYDQFSKQFDNHLTYVPIKATYSNPTSGAISNPSTSSSSSSISKDDTFSSNNNQYSPTLNTFPLNPIHQNINHMHAHLSPSHNIENSCKKHSTNTLNQCKLSYLRELSHSFQINSYFFKDYLPVASTKVIYYMDKSVTPYMTTISKK
jgi:hypothetical protein